MMNVFNWTPLDDEDDDHGGLQEDAFILSLIKTYNIMIYGRRKAKKRRKKMVVPKRMDWDKDFEMRTNEMCERVL